MSVDLSEQYDKIYRYCYFKVKNQYMAEDLTQETFLRYFSQTSYINRGKPLAYLYTIARNLCVDYYRKKQPSERLDEIEVSAEVAKRSIEAWQIQITQFEDTMVLEAAIARLPGELSELLVFRYVNGLSVGEIGEILGVSRFAVYRREKEALKRLQELLREGE